MKTKKLLSIILSVTMILCMLPLSALPSFAAGTHELTVTKEGGTASEGTDYEWNGGKLIIKTDGLTVSGTTSSECIEADPDVSALTFDGVNITTASEFYTAVVFDGNAALTLAGNNTLSGVFCIDFKNDGEIAGSGSLIISDAYEAVTAERSLTVSASGPLMINGVVRGKTGVTIAPTVSKLIAYSDDEYGPIQWSYRVGGSMKVGEGLSVYASNESKAHEDEITKTGDYTDHYDCIIPKYSIDPAKSVLIVHDKHIPTEVYRDNEDGTHAKKCRYCEEYINTEPHIGGELTKNDDGTYSMVCRCCGAFVEKVEWQPWSLSNSLPEVSGEYRLETDVTMAKTWEIPKGKKIILDLNGHTVKRDLTEATGYGYVIKTAGELMLIDDSESKNGRITGGNGRYTGAGNTGNGGGLYVADGASVLMRDIAVTGNHANYGGGLYICENAAVEIIDCHIDDNTAAGAAGIYNKGSLTVSGGTLSGNRTTGNSGGFYGEKGTADFTDCEINDNRSDNYAGAFFIDYSAAVSLKGCTVSGNAAANGGGAFEMENDASVLTLEDCEITGNSVDNVVDGIKKGGGIHFYKGSVTFIGKTVIENNTCNDTPANICMRGNEVTFDASRMSADSTVCVNSDVLEAIDGITAETFDTLVEENGYHIIMRDGRPSSHAPDHTGAYRDNGDGTHSRKCTACDEYSATEEHTMQYTDGSTHRCVYCERVEIHKDADKNIICDVCGMNMQTGGGNYVLSGSTNGQTIGVSGETVYYNVESDTTCSATKAGTSGLSVADGATVYIRIPKGVTLTCIGADGSGMTGGGAGILLPENAVLYLVGEGTVNARGGKGGNATDGERGTDGTGHDNVFEASYAGGDGGNGGNGGGGAGAGIGTAGGSGNIGGIGGKSDSVDFHYDITGNTPGTAGENGSAAAASGIMYAQSTLTLNACGGDSGSSGNGGNRGELLELFVPGIVSSNRYCTAVGGGGGGGGGKGGKGADIGTGGTGGGGGGGGNSGGGTSRLNGYSDWGYADGGCGGSADGGDGVVAISDDPAGGSGGEDGTHTHCFIDHKCACGEVDLAENGRDPAHTLSGAYQINADGTHSMICLKCVAGVNIEQHSFVNHLCVCGATDEHNFIGEYRIDPDGTHSQKCTGCDEYGNTEAHEFTGEYRSNADGTHSQKCVCGEYGNPEAHDIGDEYADNGDGTCSRNCSYCGLRLDAREHVPCDKPEHDDVYTHSLHCRYCGTVISTNAHRYENGSCICGTENETEYLDYDEKVSGITSKICDTYTVVYNDITAWEDGKWYAAIGKTSIESVTITGDVHLILTNGCELTVNGLLSGEGHLHIHAQSAKDGEKPGALVINGSNKGTALAVTDITVNGGEVTVNGCNGGDFWGGNGCAAIAADTLTVNGGKLTAVGGKGGIGSDGRDSDYYDAGNGGGGGSGSMAINVKTYVQRSCEVTVIGGSGGDGGARGVSNYGKDGIGGSGGSGSLAMSVTKMTVYGGSMTIRGGWGGIGITGGNGANGGGALSVKETLTVYGGTVSATAGNGGVGGNFDNYSTTGNGGNGGIAIAIEGSLTMYGGDLAATAGNGGNSGNLDSHGNIYGDGGNGGDGLTVGESLIVNGGTVTATNGIAGSNPYFEASNGIAVILSEHCTLSCSVFAKYKSTDIFMPLLDYENMVFFRYVKLEMYGVDYLTLNVVGNRFTVTPNGRDIGTGIIAVAIYDNVHDGRLIDVKVFDLSQTPSPKGTFAKGDYVKAFWLKAPDTMIPLCKPVEGKMYT